MKLTKSATSECEISRDTFEIRFTPQGTRAAYWYDVDKQYQCWNPKIIDDLYDLTEGPATRISVTGNVKVFNRKSFWGDTITITTFIVESWRKI